MHSYSKRKDNKNFFTAHSSFADGMLYNVLANSLVFFEVSNGASKFIYVLICKKSFFEWVEENKIKILGILSWGCSYNVIQRNITFHPIWESNIESIKSLNPNINRNKLTTLLKVKKGENFLKSNRLMPPHMERDAKSILSKITQARPGTLVIKSLIFIFILYLNNTFLTFIFLSL